MRKKMLSALLVIHLIIGLPMMVLADYRSYTPPPKKGYVYVVIKYKSATAVRGQETNVKIIWGDWSRSESFTAGRAFLPGRGLPTGFVIRLSHKKNDSVPVEVETNGRIFGISQSDSPPDEWTNKSDYKQIVW